MWKLWKRENRASALWNLCGLCGNPVEAQRPVPQGFAPVFHSFRRP